MMKRLALGIYLHCAFWLVLFVSKSHESRPNILFILSDDLGWNDIGYNNASDILTPNINDLAYSGLILNNYYIQHICSPTRSALMSGRYPIHTGLQDGVISATSPYGLNLNYNIIPAQLKKYANYSTHMIGKWHIGFYNWSYVPTSRGYDTFFGYYLGAEDYYQHNREYDGVKGYDLRNYTNPIRRDGNYSAYLYGNETINILSQYNEKNDNPFFIYLALQSVHAPLEAPAQYINEYNKTIPIENRRKKAGMVSVMDYVIGKIILKLKENNNKLWNNTLIIFSTDNGGPIDSGANNYPLRGSKATLWEGGVRGAGFINGGYLNNNRKYSITNELIHITDWLPTLCSFAGFKAENISNNQIKPKLYPLDGFDMSNVIQNNNIKSQRNEILHNIDPVNCNLTICGGIRYNNWKLVVGQEVAVKNDNRGGWNPLSTNETVNQNYPSVKCNNNTNGGNILPQPTVNYSACPFNGEPCLFNILNDPCEYYDVKNENQDIYQKLYSKLLDYNKTMVTPLNTIHKANASGADPSKHGGFWGPWE